MSRRVRPRMPGVMFHITSRLQGHAPHFTGLEADIAGMIRSALDFTDLQLVAFAVMPNHLHLVVIQAERPLGHFMQPLLRRIALLLQRKRRCLGHVVERRYRERACLTPEYARSAIAYVHLNAVRKRLARDAGEYAWSSYNDFCAAIPTHPRSAPCVENALRLYAFAGEDDLQRCARNYRSFIAWRRAMDAWLAQEDESSFHAPSPMSFPAGDEHWCTGYMPLIKAAVEGRVVEPHRMDLRDLALNALRQSFPELELDDLRDGSCARKAVSARREIIRRASSVGYSGKTIATFLRISPATVSTTLRRR